MVRAVRASSSPASVKCTLREITSYSGSPTASATSLSCMEAVGCVTCMRCAAALTLPVSDSARNSLSWRKVTFIDFYRYI